MANVGGGGAGHSKPKLLYSLLARKIESNGGEFGRRKCGYSTENSPTVEGKIYTFTEKQSF